MTSFKENHFGKMIRRQFDFYTFPFSGHFLQKIHISGFLVGTLASIFLFRYTF